MASSGSPPVDCSSERSSSTPPRTFDVADAAASGAGARVSPIQLHVPGRICIPPRAPALGVSGVLKPLSCAATASASDGETPFSAAIVATCDGVTVSSVVYGGALSELEALAPSGCELAA